MVKISKLKVGWEQCLKGVVELANTYLVGGPTIHTWAVSQGIC